jgi:hypothetical protein
MIVRPARVYFGGPEGGELTVAGSTESDGE